MNNTKKLTISALYIALYIVTLALTASISFGAVQIRIANLMYALAFCFPFLVLPAGISVVLSNVLFGGLGLPDMLGGFIVAVLTTYLITRIKKYDLNKWLIAVVILTVPPLGVPMWLSVLLNLPYWPLVFSLMLGHIIPAILGVVLVTGLEKNKEISEGIVDEE